MKGGIEAYRTTADWSGAEDYANHSVEYISPISEVNGDSSVKMSTCIEIETAMKVQIDVYLDDYLA